MNYKHYQDGEWKNEENVVISGFSLGFSRGLSAFETIRTYNSKPFALSMHIQRLSSAIEVLGIHGFHLSEQEILEIISAGMKMNSMHEATIKIIVATGENEGFLSSSHCSVMIQFFDLKIPDKDMYTNGATLISMEIPRTLPEYKTIDYAPAKISMMIAKKNGVDDILYVEGDEVRETTISNIFALIDGEWITPIRAGILNGITRQLLLKMMQENSIRCSERVLTLSDLLNAEEVFMCGSVKEVLGVTEIDGGSIGSGGVGTHTESIATLFKDFTQNY